MDGTKASPKTIMDVARSSNDGFVMIVIMIV
jgi:hypothetical protein